MFVTVIPNNQYLDKNVEGEKKNCLENENENTDLG